MNEEHNKTFELMTQWRERALKAEELMEKLLKELNETPYLVKGYHPIVELIRIHLEGVKK